MNRRQTSAVDASPVEIDQFLMRLDYSGSTTLEEVAADMESAQATIAKLRDAINQASYKLSPNQGEQPSPDGAACWLRTTFPVDHPNYLSPLWVEERYGRFGGSA